MFSKMVEAGSPQPVSCGLLKVLADWMGTQASDLLTVGEGFLFSALVQGREVSSSFYGNGGSSGPRKGRLVAVSMETVEAVVQGREVSRSFYGNGGSSGPGKGG